MHPLIPAHPVDNRAGIIAPGGIDYINSVLFHLYYLESYEMSIRIILAIKKR